MTALPPHFKQTASGRAFDVLNPTPDQIAIEDIAHALACTSRYGGHAPEPTSIAQHSVLVSLRAEQLAHGDQVVAAWGLLHDAAEAYVGDMIRPIKRLPQMAPFREAERLVLLAILHRFGLPELEPAEVCQADADLLATEAHLLFPVEQRPAPWGLTGVVVPDLDVRPWPWRVAKERFLDRFTELGLHEVTHGR